MLSSILSDFLFDGLKVPCSILSKVLFLFHHARAR
jgi:hypothetical protein